MVPGAHPFLRNKQMGGVPEIAKLKILCVRIQVGLNRGRVEAYPKGDRRLNVNYLMGAYSIFRATMR